MKSIKSKILVCIYLLLFSFIQIIFANDIKIVSKYYGNNITSIKFLSVKGNLPIVSQNGKKTILIKFPRKITKIITQMKGIGFVKKNSVKNVIVLTLYSDHILCATKKDNSSSAILLRKNIVKKDFRKKKIDNIPIKINVFHSLERDEASISFVQKCKICVFQTGSKLWIVLNKEKNYQGVLFPALTKIGIRKWQTVPCKNATVISVDVGKWKAMDIKDDLKSGKVIINLSKKVKRISNKTNIILKQTVNSYIYELGCQSSIHEFFDPYNKTRMKVVSFANFNMGVGENASYDDFDVKKTIHGIVFTNCTKSLKIINDEKKILIPKARIFNFKERIESILPLESQGEFLEQKFELQQSINNAESLESKISCMHMLYKLYFSKGFYHESLNTILEIKQLRGEATNDIKLDFVEATLYKITKQNDNARAAFDNLCKNYLKQDLPMEVIVWFDCMKQDYKMLASCLNNFVSDYHEEIFWDMIFDAFETMWSKNSFYDAKSLYDKVGSKVPSNRDNLCRYKCHKSMIMSVFENKSKAKQYLKNTTSSVEYGPSSMLVKTLYYKYLYDLDLIDEDAFLSKCQTIKFEPREEFAEKILFMQIAELYNQKSLHIDELRTLKYIKDNFQIEDKKTQQRLKELYVDIFFEKKNNKLNDFDFISLFNEFKDLMPIDAMGDKIALIVVKKLVNLDLLDQAINILEHQVEYRSKGIDALNQSYYLSLLYLLNFEPEKVEKILNKTTNEEITLNEHKKKLRIIAKSYLDLKKYDEAINYIKNDSTEEGFLINKEVLFQGCLWNKYITLVKPYILSIFYNFEKDTLDDNLKQDISRLCISYLMTENYDSFNSLIKLVKSRDEDFYYMLKQLNSKNPLKSYKEIKKYNDINQVNKLMEKYRTILFDKI